MTHTIRIKLNTIEEIKDFAKTVTKFYEDIDVYKENPNDYYDAKSIMGLFAIDTSNYVNVRINTKDKDRIILFIDTMKKYKKEKK